MLIKGWTWMEKWMGNQFDLVVAADSFTALQFTKPPSIIIPNVPTLDFIRDVLQSARSNGTKNSGWYILERSMNYVDCEQR